MSNKSVKQNNSSVSLKTVVITVAALVAFSIVFTILFQSVIGIALVSGESMKPTLYNGQVLFFSRNTSKMADGDILIIKLKEEKTILIKRLIASPGEYVEIIDGVLYVNGERQEKDYDSNIKFAGCAEERIYLKENEYFVLGDNRNGSNDSRYSAVGLIEKEEIIGVVKGK